MDISAYIDIPILVIVYVVMEIFKRTFMRERDDIRRLIPLIALFLGATISILIFYIWPELSTNVNGLNAFASGAVSGTAATGSNQVYKQISNFFTTGNSNNE